ncbi:hypothetical protein AAU61_20905 [Desulfocarbo indianensis]|nr:hypothetical protein AAU61_20905 [Desulfocarbo indianensis]
MPEDIIDLVTGRLLPYHDDEYIRQAAEKLLLEDRGWPRERLGVEYRRTLTVCCEPFEVRADLVLMAGGAPALVMRASRGSLVSREKETIAAARLIHDPIVPFCLVYNGEDAELIEAKSGKVLASGLTAVPGPQRLQELLDATPPHHASQDEIEKAAKVYSAFAFIQCPGVCRA